MNKPRTFIETHIDSNDSVWIKPDYEDIIESDNLHGDRSIFPMHSALRLFDVTFDKMHALGLHCRELHRLRQL